MYAFGADLMLHVFNLKVPGKVREIQRLQPQLLDENFIRENDGFWQEVQYKQEELVSEVFEDQDLAIPCVWLVHRTSCEHSNKSLLR